MTLLIASDLQKDIVGKPLLRGVSFKLEPRERMTIAGRNGAGKTTLLRMLAGEDSIDRGELVLGKGVRIALHDQRPPREASPGAAPLSLRDYVLSGCAEELAIEAQLAELEREMGDAEVAQSTLDRYARAQARLEARGGYLWRDRATAMARGLGFGGEDFDRPLNTFSGGQLTRASLARALAIDAEVLLLDEPTNHLDIESLEWLEQTLTSTSAAVVLVAHDRWFLEAVGTSVLELYGNEPTRSRFFSGTWTAWRREQASRELALGRAIDAQRAEIARLERFVERFRAKATKARQAQSRVKRLAKMERIEADPRDEKGLEFSFNEPERTGRVIFELSDGEITVGGEPDGSGAITLLHDVELWLERDEHVVLVGPNGTGKTTLIETLTGRRPLPAGKLSTGHNVKLGYLSQHAEELAAAGARGMNADPTVLEVAQHATGLPPNRARSLLGRFLFSGEDAEKPLAGLSGGERQRLSLAILVNGDPKPPNVLILDEPTNHLDLESREALEDALRAFPGALLLISHDRALLDAVGSRTVAIEDGSLRSYIGGWLEYVRVRDERRAEGLDPAGAPRGTTSESARRADRAAANGAASHGAASHGATAGVSASVNGASGPGSSSRKAGRQSAGKGGAAGKNGKDAQAPTKSGPSKNRLREQQKAERAIEAAEEALRSLEEELSDPAAWATKYETGKSEARHTAAKRAVEDAYSRLEALVD
jgi:ATP-binding cassette subfamily F protein 3